MAFSFSLNSPVSLSRSAALASDAPPEPVFEADLSLSFSSLQDRVVSFPSSPTIFPDCTLHVPTTSHGLPGTLHSTTRHRLLCRGCTLPEALPDGIILALSPPLHEESDSADVLYDPFAALFSGVSSTFVPYSDVSLAPAKQSTSCCSRGFLGTVTSLYTNPGLQSEGVVSAPKPAGRVGGIGAAACADWLSCNATFGASVCKPPAMSPTSAMKTSAARTDAPRRDDA